MQESKLILKPQDLVKIKKGFRAELDNVVGTVINTLGSTLALVQFSVNFNYTEQVSAFVYEKSTTDKWLVPYKYMELIQDDPIKTGEPAAPLEAFNQENRDIVKDLIIENVALKQCLQLSEEMREIQSLFIKDLENKIKGV